MRNSLICIFLSALSLFACTEADDLAIREGVVVSFTTPGMESGGSENTRAVTNTYVPLDKNATVRVLVYRRKGVNANLSVDEYIGENTYAADSYGQLSACVVDADGKKTTGAAAELRLIQGDYDFYAITPALPVSDHKTLSVKHGMDYATSLTTASIPTDLTASGKVTLTTLDRKCSKIEFNFDRKSTNVSQIAIDEVRLIDMSKGPLMGTLAQNLPNASVITDTIKLGSSVFTIDATDAYKATGSTIALPKPAGDLKLGMKLKFNGFNKVITLTPATIKGLALAKGTRYIFKVKLKGGSVVLTLTVADWSGTYNVNADDLGESNSLTLKVGEWENVDFNASTGGSQDVTIGDWTASKDWSDNLGEYPGLSSTTIGGSDIWGSGINTNPSTGGSSDAGNSGWGNEVNDDLNNNGSNPNNGWGGSSNTNPGDIGNIGGQGDV